MTKRALLVIDYTNDFVASDGALTCGKSGQDIQAAILKRMEEFNQTGDYVIFPTDTHFLNDKFHPETKLFPAHNIAGTPGHDLYNQVGVWFKNHQSQENVWQYDKNRYSAFVNTNLDNFLRERGVTEVWLTGVCTDICVLHTAVDAYNYNYQITVPSDCVATFTEYGQAWGLQHFENSLGATIL